MNSATLPSAMSPKASVATTFLILAAKRCSFVARASPSVTFEVEAMKASIFTMPDLSPEVALAFRPKSRSEFWPAVTVTVTVSGSRPE